MVTWSVVGASSPLSEFFASGLAPDNDSANFAAVSFVASLCSVGEALYYIQIGSSEEYVISVSQACDSLRRASEVLDALWELYKSSKV